MTIKTKDGRRIECIQIYLSDKNLTYRAINPKTGRYACFRELTVDDIASVFANKSGVWAIYNRRNRPRQFSLDDKCEFEIIECNGMEFITAVESGGEFPTFRQILEKAVGDYELGSYNIIAQSFMEGLVLNYGNYHTGKIDVIGETEGFV